IESRRTRALKRKPEQLSLPNSAGAYADVGLGSVESVGRGCLRVPGQKQARSLHAVFLHALRSRLGCPPHEAIVLILTTAPIRVRACWLRVGSPDRPTHATSCSRG